MKTHKRTSPQKVKAHFKKVDPKIYAVLKDVNFDDWYNAYAGRRKPNDYFKSLCYTIIGQQLSGKVASTIQRRFEELFPQKKITAERVSKLSDQKLRDVGMSWSKASFLKDLADKTLKKEINYAELHEMKDEEIMKELMQVKGIGPWSAEMFLMFALGREDVFSHADLGLRNGMKRVYGLKSVPDAKKADKLTDKWKPYRSYGSFALWHSID